MFGRIALAAALLTGLLALAEAHADAGLGRDRPIEAPAAETPAAETPAERDTCRPVKVVYAGHGEPDRTPCRPR